MECMEHSSRACDVCGLVPVAPRLSGATQIVCEGPAMQALLTRAGRFAASDAPVLIQGETGTGKEVIARILHANSKRKNAPFVSLNVAALPSELLESELFGHSRGAFTGAARARRGLFEEADGGTLFLDEIGEMPMALQAKLLRVLQDGEIRRVGENEAFIVDVRILSATHRDLRARVADGRFREDLYYRLKVLGLLIPPLRERREDILPLAHQLLRKERSIARCFSAEAESLLKRYPWPGNVRELENAIRHGAALALGPSILPGDLPDELHQEPVKERDANGASNGECAPVDRRSLKEVEREHILRIVDASKGSLTEAARTLGIARNTLWRKLRKYAEEDEEARQGESCAS